MIVEVRNAFKDNVNYIPWMDSTTKMAVAEKVMTFLWQCNASQLVDPRTLPFEGARAFDFHLFEEQMM